MGASAIVGREIELGAIESFLVDVEQGAVALVLAGEAGIGKTILWEACVEEAEERFGRVLSCRGIKAEAGLSFGGLSDLLSDVLGDVAEDLVPLRRNALEVALLLAEPGAQPADPRAIGIAVLDVLRLLADRGPVVVAVDDLQWVDAASRGALQLAARRLRSERVGFLATVLEAPGLPPLHELEPSLPHQVQLSVGPLDSAALHRLLEDRIGMVLSRPDLTRLGDATAGNPFFALEVGRELARDTTRLESAGQLPIPDSLSTLLGRRMDRLPRQTRQALLVVAAAGGPTADVVAAASEDREQALASLELATREGVLVLDGPRVRFAHPLLSSVCYEDAPLWRRRAVHGVLAEVVIDPEERSRHLALATDGPDAAVAAELDKAALHAAARGATAAAAELAELAARRTPPERSADRRRRRFTAGGFHRLAGDFERAGATFEELLEEIPGGAERSDVLYALATTGRADIPTRLHLCEEALGETPGDDVRQARILGFRAISRWQSGDVEGALEDARAGLELAERVGEPSLLAMALGRVGFIETWALEMTPDLLERAVALEGDLERPLDFHSSPSFILAIRLANFDEIDDARRMFESAERDAEARGDEHSRAFAMRMLIYVEWYAGRWRRALEHATVATELAEQTHELQYMGAMAAARARLESDLGLLDRARASAEHGLECSRTVGDEIYVVFNLGALGCIELAQGNFAAASILLKDLPARLLAAGHRLPGPLDFWPETIEALIAVGELDDARECLVRYEGLAHLAGRRVAACARRCRGSLAASEGDLPAAFAAFDESLAELGSVSYPLERGRALLGLGAARRQARQKRPARDVLEQAHAIFEELAAPIWAEKAQLELGRISGRRTSPGQLSDTEKRVAILAADGRTNKEIAAELYMSVRTVEAHLSRTYAKLGVRSRTALARHHAIAPDDAVNAAERAANM